MGFLQIEDIRGALLHDFRPGEDAHRTMMSYNRALAKDARKMDPPPKESAVLFLIYSHHNEPHTIFMERPQNQGVHSGQLSFPGGKKEGQEDTLHTALRETREELGFDTNAVEIIGELSELYIPPSNFLVQPYIGYMASLPDLQPNPAEVRSVLQFPVQQLLEQPLDRKQSVFIPRYNATIEVPYFDIHGKTLWGATAMMIAEFRMIMEKYFHP